MKLFLPTLLLLTSCSLFKRSEEAHIKDNVSQVFYFQQKKLKRCAENSKVFKKLDSKRVVATLNIQFSEAKLLQFTVNEAEELPPAFVECLFKVCEKMDYPDTKEGVVVEFSQPLYFHE